jgi:two-component system chemotaxis response regulator CheB
VSEANRVTVLVVDDSPLVRRMLKQTFEADPEFEVVGEAANGRQAVEQAVRLQPNLITIDLDMPVMDGLAAIGEIMARAPTRILVVTGHPTYKGLDASAEARARGALELVAKPSGWPGSLHEQEALRRLARLLATVPVLPHVQEARRQRLAARQLGPDAPRAEVRTGRMRALDAQAPSEVRLIAVGASTGGPGVVKEMLAGLPEDLAAPVVIVQHLSEISADGFVKWLGDGARLRVQEAVPGTAVQAGAAYVALRGPHVTVSPEGVIEACHDPPRSGNCPAVDVLFESVARAYGAAAAGVLLTGMGRDGASGLLRLREAGGVTLIQDEATSSIFGMPRAALELGAAQMTVPRQHLAEVLVQLIRRRDRDPP